VKQILKRAAAFAAIGVMPLAVAAAPAFAGASDYEFQLVNKDIKAGKGAEIAVRLVHKPDGKPVADAVIFATRLDMGPDGMETMTAAVEKQAGSEAGVYRFKANLAMAGGWAFSLGAKVQGETETVQGKLVIRASE